MNQDNIGHTTITIPVRMKDKYLKLKQLFTTQKLGCKIPSGVIMVQALEYVTEKMQEGTTAIEFNHGAVLFKDVVVEPIVEPKPLSSKKNNRPMSKSVTK